MSVTRKKRATYGKEYVSHEHIIYRKIYNDNYLKNNAMMRELIAMQVVAVAGELTTWMPMWQVAASVEAASEG